MNPINIKADLINLAGIFISYVVLRWAADATAVQFGKAFKKVFIKTDRDMAIWLHYKKRTTGQGHKPKSPVVCQDENCSIVYPVFTSRRKSRAALRRKLRRVR